jgi:hypothetical protein
MAKEQDVISISGVETYNSKCELNFTTVSKTGGPFVRLVFVDAILSWLSPSEAVVPTSDLDTGIIKRSCSSIFWFQNRCNRCSFELLKNSSDHECSCE